jgi:hypothetical protein
MAMIGEYELAIFDIVPLPRQTATKLAIRASPREQTIRLDTTLLLIKVESKADELLSSLF